MLQFCVSLLNNLCVMFVYIAIILFWLFWLRRPGNRENFTQGTGSNRVKLCIFFMESMTKIKKKALLMCGIRTRMAKKSKISVLQICLLSSSYNVTQYTFCLYTQFCPHSMHFADKTECLDNNTNCKAS